MLAWADAARRNSRYRISRVGSPDRAMEKPRRTEPLPAQQPSASPRVSFHPRPRPDKQSPQRGAAQISAQRRTPWETRPTHPARALQGRLNPCHLPPPPTRLPRTRATRPFPHRYPARRGGPLRPPISRPPARCPTQTPAASTGARRQPATPLQHPTPDASREAALRC